MAIFNSIKKNIYLDILEKSRSQTFRNVKESQLWFREKAININKSSINPIKVIKERELVSKIQSLNEIGKLFLFNYSPKTKDTLPYYDTFPIVFPFDITKTGFLGLNLHYLPPPFRAILMDNLYNILSSNDLEDDTTRLRKLTYKYLNSQKNLRSFSPCIKSYLHSHIRSKIAFIPPSEWELALFLPLQRFQKQTESKVWKDSLDKIKKRK